MATIALSLAGQVVGGLLGGPIGATIGRALGALAGSAIDGAIFGEQAPPRAGSDVRLQGSSEGTPIPRLYGWSRISGNIIWAADLEEITEENSGAKASGPAPATETSVVASFALGLCEGEVARLGRIWADGQVLDTAALTLRFYRGGEAQAADSLIEAKQGADAPAYRGLCYIVFERLPLEPFGNRIPMISVELCRVVGALEPAITAVTLIPGASEFGYDPVPRSRSTGPGRTVVENHHLSRHRSDWEHALDELTALCPNLKQVALVVAWFGDDLRAGHCTIRPRVEGADRLVVDAEWQVAGIARAAAQVVSSDGGGPAYGGTPDDAAVIAAIRDLTRRGLAVTFYPIILMDIPRGNSMGQPPFPWRGRIAPEVDRSARTTEDLKSFASRYRDFIMHYAQLATHAGGVDAFLIGSELRGLTSGRGPDNGFAFVTALVELAAEVRGVMGGATKLTYAADWSEYSGVQSGGGEKLFHLDPLWASPNIDAIGIDNYMPLADKRDAPGPYATRELAAHIAGGEGFDWYYASTDDRNAARRTPITDGAYGEPWVWRYKDLESWWSKAHHDRPGGVRKTTSTAWMPKSKPIWFTELGCAAIDRGANQPNVFLDPKSAESFVPYFSSGAPDALMQRQFLRAVLAHWHAAEMVERIYLWTWDARPFPSFPDDLETWRDGVNHATGHWLTGRLGVMASDELAWAIAKDFGVALAGATAQPPLIHGYVVQGPTTARAALEPVLAASGLAPRDTAAGLVVGADAPTEVAIDHAGLVADGRPILLRRRPDPGEAAGRFSLGYVDRERAYLHGAVTALAPTDGAHATAAADLVLDINGARAAAERRLAENQPRRDSVELTLPPSQLALEVGDALRLDGEPYEIVEIRDGTARKVTARAPAAPIAAQIAATRPRVAQHRPQPKVAPMMALAHLPPAAATPARTRFALGAFAAPWPGPLDIREAASGMRLTRLTRPAALGELLAPLAAGSPYLWDRRNAVELTLYSGHLSSRDDDEVLAGANRLTIAGAGGAWEILGFAKATLLAPQTYRLTRLLRGLGGSEHAIGSATAGARVLVLDARAPIDAADPAWLGAEVALESFAAGEAQATAFSAVLAVDAALPLAPAHPRARRLGNGDLELSWIRRSRADPENWSAADAPLDWAPEAYRVTILDGAREARTIESATNRATYAAALQATDFGGLPGHLLFNVAQLSGPYGPGHRARGQFNA